MERQENYKEEEKNVRFYQMHSSKNKDNMSIGKKLLTNKSETDKHIKTLTNRKTERQKIEKTIVIESILFMNFL